MKLVVIGGHSRNIGKTSVAAGLIAATRELGWTALKITQFGHGICSQSGRECDCAVDDLDHPFALTRETDASGGSDTARFLQAGAAESWWVRVPQGQLRLALPALRELFEGREYVLAESNSLVDFFPPEVYVAVVDPSVADVKESSRRLRDRVDAFVVAGTSQAVAPTAPGDPTPRFPVQPPEYISAALVNFVRAKIHGPVTASSLRPDVP